MVRGRCWLMSGAMLGVVCFITAPAAAGDLQGNLIMPYEGRLTVGGSPFTGVARMKFAVVDGHVSLWSNDGTSFVGREPASSVDVPVDKGTFSVDLGSPPMLRIPSSLFQKRESAQLRVWASTNGTSFEQLQPDQPVPLSAFEFSVTPSDGAWSVSGDDVFRVLGNVGIGTETPSSKLDVRGRVTIEAGESPVLYTGTGDQELNRYFRLLNSRERNTASGLKAGGVLVADSYAYANPGKNDLIVKGDVGIGTTEPTNQLDVLGGAAFQGNHVFIRNRSAPAGRQTWGFVVNSTTGELILGRAVDTPPRGGSLEQSIVRVHGSAPARSLVVDQAGQTNVRVLEITGGADVAEPFVVIPSQGTNIEPGMVVVIDPALPGQLRLSSAPYDRKVAGVVSGGRGLSPGLVLKAEGREDGDGKHPIALSGRVWCWVDASYGQVHAGDLLTTSSTPGMAMLASDNNRRQGAVLGKAMTDLESGCGLVLILVTLQ